MVDVDIDASIDGADTDRILTIVSSMDDNLASLEENVDNLESVGFDVSIAVSSSGSTLTISNASTSN
jgi:hypothetical protein